MPGSRNFCLFLTVVLGVGTDGKALTGMPTPSPTTTPMPPPSTTIPPAPPTTSTMPTTPALCIDQHGEVHGLWESYNLNSCVVCMCTLSGPQCHGVVTCNPPPCLNPETSPERCCSYCPQGPDCKGLEDDIIATGESKMYNDGMTNCFCPETDQHHGHTLRQPNCAHTVTTPSPIAGSAP